MRAVTSLAKAMKVDCVAEGVERGRQLKFVRMLGCRYVQGYYFSPPRNAHDILAILEEGHFDAAPARLEAAQIPFTTKMFTDQASN